MTQAKQISALQRKLGDKTQEILKLVANTHGVEDVASLDASQLQRLNEEIEEIIDQYDEALLENDSPEAWRLDERLGRAQHSPRRLADRPVIGIPPPKPAPAGSVDSCRGLSVAGP